jgi:hypothetical protein
VAINRLVERYQGDNRIWLIDDINTIDSEQLLKRCSVALDEGKKVFLTAQFRSQLPIIKIAALCNEKRKSLINIELQGWDSNSSQPMSYSSF